jgi:hypothetical protein
MTMPVESSVSPARAVNAALNRAHAAFLATQRTDNRAPEAKNIADLLERGHRGRSPGAAMLLDVLA